MGVCRTVTRPCGTIDVWWIGPLRQRLVERLAASCSAVELEHAQRIVDIETRDRQMVTRGALRRLVSSRLGVEPAAITLQVGAHGKPHLADNVGVGVGAVCFNVTHTAGLSLIAISDGVPVGIDAEPMASELEVELAVRICTAAERRRLGRLARRDVVAARGLLRTFWVRKEAVVKADGRGMQIDVSQLGVTSPPRVGGRRAGISRDIALVDLDVGADHVAAIAWSGAAEIEPVREFRLDG